MEEVVGNVGRRVEMIAEDIEGAGQKGSWGERKRKDLKIVMRGAVERTWQEFRADRMGIVEIVGIREVPEYCMTNLPSWPDRVLRREAFFFLF